VNDLFQEISNEEYRHQSEVRQHLKWRSEKGIDWYRKYISTYGFGRRKTKLLGDVAEQWNKGNRGQKGEWK
jgi:rubrerythrin